MEGPTPRRPTSEAARGRYGCIWNPEAEYRFFTVHTAVWIKTVVSITDMAVALFVGMLDVPAVPSEGGGSSSDLPWGREDEDDRA